MASLDFYRLREGAFEFWYNKDAVAEGAAFPILHDDCGVHSTTMNWMPRLARFEAASLLLNEAAAAYNGEPRTFGFCEWCAVKRVNKSFWEAWPSVTQITLPTTREVSELSDSVLH